MIVTLYRNNNTVGRDTLFDQIDPRSPTPLYAQIASRVRVAVAAAELRPGDALPSVRQLAARLRVNPATVVQAYRDLETEGFVEMRQGSGTFVRDVKLETRANERASQAAALVRRMVADAGRLGLSTNEVITAIAKELEVKVA
jgi:GntR family transcriptional regulator